MADNYLEKKSEELSRGRTIIRKANPSLDTLLKRLSAPAGDTAYVVKTAQMEAAVRSASYLQEAEGAVFETDEERAVVTVSGISDASAEGSVLLALRLKAAELHLGTDAGRTGKGLEIHFYKLSE